MEVQESGVVLVLQQLQEQVDLVAVVVTGIKVELELRQLFLLMVFLQLVKVTQAVFRPQGQVVIYLVEAVELVVLLQLQMEEKVEYQCKLGLEVRTPLPQENTMLVVVKELEVLSPSKP